MKLISRIICAVIFFVGYGASYSQDVKKPANSAGQAPTAKEYEMKQYFFVMLSKGENRGQDSATAAKIQEGHMKNIQQLADMGKLIMAGPFGDNGNWRGVFIFDCKSVEEVETLVKSDPAIVSGRLNYEIHPWWTAKNCMFK